MKSDLKQGLFITFEGGDGAGKTTLIEEIARHLISGGYSVVKTREPGSTQLGEKIRPLLLDHAGPVSPYAELCLYLASRAQHIFQIIGPALMEGKIVLCDRFNDSSVVYQGVGRGLGKSQVSEFCSFISEGLEPHLTLYLDIDPKIGLSRLKKERSQDRIESEGLSFHMKIREAYLSLSREHPHRFRLIDASLSVPQVYEAAMKWIHQLLLRQHV